MEAENARKPFVSKGFRALSLPIGISLYGNNAAICEVCGYVFPNRIAQVRESGSQF
jgi:hypothetical protein